MEYWALTDLQNQILKKMRSYDRTYSAKYLANKLSRSEGGIRNSIRTIPDHLIEEHANGEYYKPIYITMYSIS